MQVQIQKVGKSLAVPIPQAFIEAINIKEGAFIELSFSEGKLISENGSDRQNYFRSDENDLYRQI